MSPHVVLDTSVIVKWFHPGEVLADRALALRSAYLDGKIRVTVPTLLAYETANVLRFRGEFDSAQVEDAVQSLFDMELEWAPPTAPVMRRAVVIARTTDTTFYDAAFAALAEGVRATFVTADERLARRLTHLPFVRFLGEAE